jgi:hypothetical protein
MLWLLIRLACRATGIALKPSNPSWTAVTNSIEVLFGKAKNKKYVAACGAAFYGLPVSIAIAVFIALRRDYLKIPDWSFILIAIAVLWAWIGPVLIWKYETEWLKRFFRGTRKILRPVDADRLRMDNEWISRSWLKWIIPAVWATLLGLAYSQSIRFFYTSLYDWWWVGMLVGIVIYSIYTGFGFLLAMKTVYLTRKLSRMTIKIDPYDNDERGALGFVGRYAMRTSVSFASGILFIPLLLYVNIIFVGEYRHIIYGYLAFYSISIFLTFILPALNLHRAVVLEKRRRIARLRATIWRLFIRIIQTGDVESYVQYRIQHNLLIDLRNVGEWPFKVSSFILSSALTVSSILPLVARNFILNIFGIQ